ncbi:poly(A) RNA polymerase, mitochondrial-like [Mercenaria mercenaria]|uniref:poly(A) RNA polymerase, mitochondrial-like n=1 Tax=Mercenaria mercenaria TaxID=6596 RepID=UPI00234EC50C|nr:poly(A) RNA polymerase, mitochondrial-like [Mercenaria mercenaria]
MSASMRNLTFSKLKYLHSMFYRSKKTWKGNRMKEKHPALGNIGEIPLETRLTGEAEDQDVFMAYREMISDCYTTADRSLLLQLNEQDNLLDIITRVQNVYGTIKKGFYFPNDDKKKLVLVEFSYSEKLDARTPLRVKDTSELEKVKGRDKNINSLMEKIIKYQPKTYQPDSLKHCNSVSDQLMCLYKEMQMSEAMVRLHFFVGMLVLRSVRKKFKDAQVMFHGSSSCGLALEGKSDLDMVILKDDVLDEYEVLKPLSKEVRRNAGLFSHVLHLPHARVPIIKFDQIHTKMSCDLSCNRLGGILMAEMLYWLNVYEPMFYPLVIAVKMWGREHHMTSSGMGHHFSNYMLTMLMLAYLQHVGLLPALKTVYANTDRGRGGKSADILSTWRDTVLKKPKRNTGKIFLDNDIGSLLLGFFQYYSKFPFEDYIIDVHFGKVIKRPHRYDICVINPHESDHNVCKNVRAIQVDRFQQMCKHSAKILEINQEKSADNSPWGLACVLSNQILKEKKRGILFDLDIEFGTDDGQVEEVAIEVGGEDELDVSDLHVNKNTPDHEKDAFEDILGMEKDENIHTKTDGENKLNESVDTDIDIDKSADMIVEIVKEIQKQEQTGMSNKNINAENIADSTNEMKRTKKKKKRKKNALRDIHVLGMGKDENINTKTNGENKLKDSMDTVIDVDKIADMILENVKEIQNQEQTRMSNKSRNAENIADSTNEMKQTKRKKKKKKKKKGNLNIVLSES